MAFFDLEPPDHQNLLMFASHMAGMYNSSGNVKRKYKPEDFMPRRERLFESDKDRRERVAKDIRKLFGKGKK